ncbi:glycosyltransferase family 4 protein [Microbacterium sp. NPDC064584]|uniref:glycosyltransferase family 4 protein n=1 Tax=Microbacterium sp. NPDC064584 TaxID=3155817 RepID=UPI00343D1077
MTQVVNAYVNWPFEHVDVEVIESRGDPGDHVAAARKFLRAMAQVRRISRRRGELTPVLVIHLSERGSFVREGTIARYANRLGIPVIAHMHGSEFAQHEKKSPKQVAKVLAACVKVITLSEETSAICARHVDPSRVSLVPNAVPGAHRVEKQRIVVFGGVVSHRKGIDVLQEAWRQAAPDPSWQLVVAGPIRDEHLVDRSLPNAVFVGGLKHDELMSKLDTAAVAVLPSRDEAMPMFLLEAMARHTCVISTTVGGIPELLSDGCGLLVEAGSADELTDALVTATSNERVRTEIADAGWKRFQEQFSADAVYPRIEEIWLEAATGSDSVRQRVVPSGRAG